MNKSMKTIEVVAAIIQNNNTILATRRGYGEFINMWEFPGGKVELGETREDALIREINEELSIQIIVIKLINTIKYDYPDFHLIMHCYLCEQIEGTLTLNEHKDAKWINKSELYDLNWLPADILILDDIKTIL